MFLFLGKSQGSRPKQPAVGSSGLLRRFVVPGQLVSTYYCIVCIFISRAQSQTLLAKVDEDVVIIEAIKDRRNFPADSGVEDNGGTRNRSSALTTLQLVVF